MTRNRKRKIASFDNHCKSLRQQLSILQDLRADVPQWALDSEDYEIWEFVDVDSLESALGAIAELQDTAQQIQRRLIAKLVESKREDW